MPIIDVFNPNTINEVKVLLDKYIDTKLLAGGTDFMIELRRNKISPKYIIHLGNITELKEIRQNDREIIIGSTTTFTQLQENEIIKRNLSILIQCADSMGSPQIRNMATVGGNIINASSAADIIPCLIALDAILIFESIKGVREISCQEYFNKYSTEKVRVDEVLTFIKIIKDKSLGGFYKLGKRNSLSISRVCVAVTLSLKENNIENLRLCLGAVARFPIRLKELELISINKDRDWLLSQYTLEEIENYVENSIRGRTTMPYKKKAIKGAYKLAINNALSEVRR